MTALGHYSDVTIGTMTSQITSITIVYSTVYSDADKRKHQSSASLAFVRGIHRWPLNSLHKGPVTRKMFPFDDVIMVSPCELTIMDMDNKEKSRPVSTTRHSSCSRQLCYPILQLRLKRSYVACFILSQIARFMGPTWGSIGDDRTQVGSMLAPWTLLSGVYTRMYMLFTYMLQKHFVLLSPH